MAKEKSNYFSFSLPLPVKAWVIALVIRKHPRPYRWSRRGKCLFYRITTLTNRITNMSHLKGLSQNINCGNLQTIECQQPNNALRTGLSITFDCHCAVVNCRSVEIKLMTLSMKFIITVWTFVHWQKLGLKKMKTTPLLIASVHQDTTPYPSHKLIGQEGALHWSIGPIWM